MRPRITKKEAQYIVDLLTTSEKILNEYEEYYKQLQTKVAELRNMIIYDSYTACKEGIRDKKLELEKWRFKLAIEVLHNKTVHEKLKAKYQAIADGNSHRGTYKHLSHSVEFAMWFNQLPLTQVLNLETNPIAPLHDDEYSKIKWKPVSYFK